jgi:hypothetical protein
VGCRLPGAEGAKAVSEAGIILERAVAPDHEMLADRLAPREAVLLTEA